MILFLSHIYTQCFFCSFYLCIDVSPQLGTIGAATTSMNNTGAAGAAGGAAPPISAKDLKADWEQFIDQMGKSICEEQSPQRLLRIRAKLYELLTNWSVRRY